MEEKNIQSKLNYREHSEQLCVCGLLITNLLLNTGKMSVGFLGQIRERFLCWTLPHKANYFTNFFFTSDLRYLAGKPRQVFCFYYKIGTQRTVHVPVIFYWTPYDLPLPVKIHFSLVRIRLFESKLCFTVDWPMTSQMVYKGCSHTSSYGLLAKRIQGRT